MTTNKRWWIEGENPSKEDIKIMIIKLREKFEIPQEALADMLFITHKEQSDIEDISSDTVPNFEYFEKLADKLELKITFKISE